MTITLTSDLERTLTERAKQQGTTPELLALQGLRELYQQPFARLSEEAITLRQPGLHAGRYWIADDFDAPLPDSFWLGGEEANNT